MTRSFSSNSMTRKYNNNEVANACDVFAVHFKKSGFNKQSTLVLKERFRAKQIPERKCYKQKYCIVYVIQMKA